MFPSRKNQKNYAVKITELMLLYCYRKRKKMDFLHLLNNECDIYRKTDLYNLKKKKFYKNKKKVWKKITKQIKEFSFEQEKKFLEKSQNTLYPYLIRRINKNKKLVEYNTYAKFGCFDFSVINGKIDLHMPVFRFMDPQYFRKKKYSSHQKFLIRSRDLLNLIKFVKKKYPKIVYVQMGSWMNQFKPFRVLFPKNWSANGKIKKKNSIAWWGQFLKSDGDINSKLYKKFKSVSVFKYSGLFYQCKVDELHKYLKRSIK